MADASCYSCAIFDAFNQKTLSFSQAFFDFPWSVGYIQVVPAKKFNKHNKVYKLGYHTEYTSAT